MTKEKINGVYSKKDTSCDCESCRNACLYCPGWFLPDEIEGVAAYLKLSIQELFKLKLAVNWWVGDEGEDDIFLLAPAIKTSEPGNEYPADPRGECVFYKEGQCEIYSARPFECRKYIHRDPKEEADIRHEVVALAWKDSQKWVTKLLGRTPEASTFASLDMLFNPFC